MLSERHKKAIEYAVNQIQDSPISPYVKGLILFGSCARREESWNSDVDLCLVLLPEVKEMVGFSRKIHELKGIISSDELDSVEVDLKIVVGDDWERSSTAFFENIRKDGIILWQ